jgi:hypothetical protein
MYYTNKDIKQSLQDALNEVSNTEINETSIHYLHGYLTESIRQTIMMVERMELDEKYRRQEEAEFNSHLG